MTKQDLMKEYLRLTQLLNYADIQHLSDEELDAAEDRLDVVEALLEVTE